MKDRVPLYPGRVKLTPVSGQENTYDMVRADEPTQEGTPLNKASLLRDETAALFGFNVDAVPNDVLNILTKSILLKNNTTPVLQNVLGEDVTDDIASALGITKIETGSYVGTGNSGSSNQNTLTFSFEPKLVIVVPTSTINMTWVATIITMIRPNTSTVTFANAGSYGVSETYITVSWGANSVSWYGKSAEGMMNYSDVTYAYVAIG